MPDICLCLTAETMAQNNALFRQYRSCIDMVELRVDLLSDAEQATLRADPELAVREFHGVDSILTVRRKIDGGSWKRSEVERIALLEHMLPAGFTSIDVEADQVGLSDRLSLIASARAAGVTVIASRHYMEYVPTDLDSELQRLSAIGDYAKIAARPNGIADFRRLLHAARAHAGPHVVLGMGSYGVASRIMGHTFGNRFTFSSAADVQQAASGHISPDVLQTLYAHGETGSATRYFAVAGDPIAHSKSPEYHNRRFRADGLNALYVPFRVDDFDEFMELARELPLSGISVTVPHKESAARAAATVNEGVTATRACNTLIRQSDGSYRGVNTDIEGFLSAIRTRLSTFRGATVLGAGGAARAAVYALASEGVPVLVCNRTLSRAQTLVAELGEILRDEGQSTTLSAAALPGDGTDLGAYGDLIVQTSSVGMHPDHEGDPIPAYRFCGTETVYDIIYTPPMTPILKRAQQAGCAIVNGSGMFDAQADAQYRLFRTVLP